MARNLSRMCFWYRIGSRVINTAHTYGALNISDVNVEVYIGKCQDCVFSIKGLPNKSVSKAWYIGILRIFFKLFVKLRKVRLRLQTGNIFTILPLTTLGTVL